MPLLDQYSKEPDFGEWTFDRTTDPKDENDWNTVFVKAGCALLIKNTAPTKVGNQDVADLLNGFYYNNYSGDTLEERGVFNTCSNDVVVEFWLRGTWNMKLDWDPDFM
ncbi:hypothetical protein F5Y06DRAFT_307382 [Hypoxylon sp. FL0890]|nr:hypothetical protein F5Y06DRAFT_307382 [Hypoxylon sp. FL0890]